MNDIQIETREVTDEIENCELSYEYCLSKSLEIAILISSTAKEIASISKSKSTKREIAIRVCNEFISELTNHLNDLIKDD